MKAILKKYGIEDADLESLTEEVRRLVESTGIEVRFVDLRAVIEQDILGTDAVAEQLGSDTGEKHHETAISDGRTLYLHDELEEFGLAGRLYDLLHMGAGHVWQWSSTADSGLEFHGDIGWELGSKFHLGATEEVLQQVYRYERESSCIAMGNLDMILTHDQVHDDEWKARMRRFLNDYLSTDLDYIVDYYRTGRVYDFTARWQRHAPQLPAIAPRFTITPKQRDNLCIPLIVK